MMTSITGGRGRRDVALLTVKSLCNLHEMSAVMAKQQRSALRPSTHENVFILKRRFLKTTTMPC